MLRTIAVIAQEPVAISSSGVLCEVFGIDRTDDGVPAFDFRVCSARPGEVLRTTSGMGIVAPPALDAAAVADLVAIPAGSVDGPYEPEVLDVLRETVDRGGRVLSVCSGAFTARGRRPARRPRVHDPLEVCRPAGRGVPRRLRRPRRPLRRGRSVLTSAGTAAGIDACLHLVRTELGSEVATRIARRMVVPAAPLRRSAPVRRDPRPRPAVRGPPGRHGVGARAARRGALGPVAGPAGGHVGAHLRPPLHRRGRHDPAQVAHGQRVLRARHLLESTDLDVERIARESGFATAAVLRHHFQREIGIPPVAYRRLHEAAGLGLKPAMPSYPAL